MKYNMIMGISVLPALLIMPAMADNITQRQVISQSTTYTDLTATNISSTVSNNGGVFYMQDVPDVTLTFDGTTTFSGNSLNNGGMGGAIGNGWLSSTTGTGFTPGGKIVFNGNTTFSDNSTNNKNGGGAIFNYGNGTTSAPDIAFNGPTIFNKNAATDVMTSVYIGGGAINHRGGAIIFDDVATFSENTSASKGGAIMTAGDMLFNNTATFDKNTATANGGALAILGGNTTFASDASFTNNSAGAGAAIFIGQTTDTVTFNGTATFADNTGTGIILNGSANAKIVFADGATFDSNTNNQNGSLVNAGNVSLNGGDFIFTNNTGSNGGGLKNSGTVTANTAGNILFSSNTTTSSAGALDNGGAITLTATQTTFTNNTANAGYGGAIFNAGDLSILGQNNTFSNNNANDTGATKSGGGAIHNRGNANIASLIIGTDSSVNTFSSNASNSYGGAIVSRAFDGTGQDSDVVINGTTTFSGNRATLDGGAIWNNATPSNGTTGNATIVFNGDTMFTNNTSGGRGGAIYNNDTITFNGIAEFSNNTANGATNDIYNDGIVNFNGDARVSGGIDGTGTLNIANGATLNIGTASITQGAIALDGTMLATLRSGDSQINVVNEGGFTGDGTIKLSFDSAGTYKVFGNQTFGNVDIASSIYDLTWNGGNVTATTKSVADIASQNNLSDTAARTVANVSESSSARLNDLSVLIQEYLSAGTASDQSAVEHAAHAINPEKSAVIQSVGTHVQNVLNHVTTDRMGLGHNGGDVNVAPGGIWAQGIYNKSKLNDAFNGYTRGVAVGADSLINDIWTIGIGYMFGHSDIGANTRNTEIDSHSVFAYGQYRPSNWYMNTIVNYTMSDYSEEGAALGIPVSADYDLDSFGANVAMGYDFIGGLTPEVSLRYIHTGSADYSNSFGIRNKIDAADYLTASLGTHYGFDMLLNNGVALRPTVHYAVKYDIMSDDNNITVTMPGVNAYVLDGDNLSRIANQIGVGVTMMYGAFNMSLNYDIEARADYTSQTGRVKFRYEF